MMSIQDIPVEQFLYGSFLKFKELFQMTNKELSQSNSMEVNIFIDLNQFLLPIYNCNRYNNRYSIASIIINYGLHFRQFYRSRYGVYANIILVYPNPKDFNMSNIQRCEGFNQHNRNRMFSNAEMYNIIEENMKLVETISPYLPNFFFKRGSAEASVLIGYLIEHIFASKPVPNVVISSAEFAHQLPHVYNTIVFKRLPDMNSYSYNQNNTFASYLHDSRHYDGQVPHSKYIPICWALNGLQSRNVHATLNIKTTMNLLNSLPTETLVDVRDPLPLYNAIQEYLANNYTGKAKVHENDFINKFKSLDLSMLIFSYSFSANAKDFSFMNRMDDPKSVRYINDKYFKQIPLNLENA